MYLCWKLDLQQVEVMNIKKKNRQEDLSRSQYPMYTLQRAEGENMKLYLQDY